MTPEENHFHAIGQAIDHAVKGQLFGKPCSKISGKAFVCFYAQNMVFKLPDIHRTDALSYVESSLFDPSKKGRPMKEWVQVTYDHQEKWLSLAQEAKRYIVSQNQ